MACGMVCDQECVKGFWRFSWHTYFGALREFSSPYYGEPFDISPGRFLYAVLFGLLSAIVSLAVVAAVGACKAPFLVLR